MQILHKDGHVLLEVPGDTLVGANLSEANLTRANLIEANLTRANLIEANLTRANLTRAKLSSADLAFAEMTRVNLRGADLSDAELCGADLSGADLSGADLSSADLSGANLDGADLSGASLTRTTFTFCDNLHEAKGLDAIEHFGPCSLDATTLRASVCKLPRRFLEGVGYSREEIENLQAMYQESAFKYYSCFLSSANDDREFADRLYSDLLNANVSCWHYRDDMRGGKDWQPQINEQIRVKDKLVLICSQRSIYKPNVVREILEAIDCERGDDVQKLFPIRLDDHILGESMMEEAREMVKSGEWPRNWVFNVKKKHIPDFSNWKDHDAYKVEFEKLIRDLKAT